MIQKVTGLSMAVHEQLELYKHRYAPRPGNDTGRRVCIVTGIHGDELEGQYVAFLLGRRLKEHQHHPAGRAAVRFGYEPHFPRRGRRSGGGIFRP